jgi:hypothetical protein
VTFNPGLKDFRIEIIDKKEPINRTLTPEAIPPEILLIIL